MKTVNTLVIPRWFDRHLHLRDGKMLETVLPCTLNQQAVGAVIMGNLKSPDETSTIHKTVSYRTRIMRAAEKALRKGMTSNQDFTPCMTLYLTDEITPEEVLRGYVEGAWCAVKLYIAGQGGTTNSSKGVKDLLGRYPVFEIMQEHGIPLLGHFEAVEETVDEFDREIVSVERDLQPLLKAFPGLIVVFEHLTDGRAADFVAQAEYSINATVTAHHLMINRGAMFWGGMNPGYYCKPVPKRESHQKHIRRLVTSGCTRFGAGTDSAPHDEQVKSCCYGCAAGIFTAPKAVEMYATVFDEEGSLENLGSFLSENFLHLYGMKVSKNNMILARYDTDVPEKIGPVQVFKGGTKLPWGIIS